MVKIDKCKNCDTIFSEDNKLGFYREINIKSNEYFCDEKCYNYYIEDEYFKDKKYKELINEIEVLKSDIELLKNEIEISNNNILDEYNKGYTEGLELSKKLLKVRNICPHCKNHIIESIHHIIPRKFNGNNEPENLIALCFDCHNKIEIITDDLFVNNQIYSSDTLFKFIINDSFPSYYKIGE